MNVIVKKHYPVEKLPEDLREGLPLDAVVTVEVTTERNGSTEVPLSRRIGSLPNIHGDEHEVIRHLREAREDSR